MSTPTQIPTGDRSSTQTVFTFRENPESKRVPSSSDATTSPHPIIRVESVRGGENRALALPVKSLGVSSEPKQAWVTLADKAGPSSSDPTHTPSCASPNAHLHDNKWAQIILRARQRQISGDSENPSPTPALGTSSERTQGNSVALSSSPAVESELKLAPQKLVEMWFSKKRPPKLETDDANLDSTIKGISGSNIEVMNPAQETVAVSKSRLFRKGDKTKQEKKQVSLGKKLAKKEEKETKEDLEFKKQCQLELEKRLSECGFGIHAPAKEKLSRDKKVKDFKKQKYKSLDAVMQTEQPREVPGRRSSSHGSGTHSEPYPSPDCVGRISHESGLETKGDISLASIDTNQGLEPPNESPKTRSLPDDFTGPGEGKRSPTDPDSSGRFSTSSLRPESLDTELEKPARRARSLLDSFRDFASKPLWKKSQRQFHPKGVKSPSTQDLITNESSAPGQDKEASALKSSPNHQSSEASKTNVLNQSAIDRGNVLRSVVFYQNRFLVMDQAKPGNKNTLEKNVREDKISENSVPDTEFAVAPNSTSCTSHEVLDSGNKKVATRENKLTSSLSFNGTANLQPKLSVPRSPGAQTYLSVDQDQSLSHCMKSESDMQLDTYYNRVQSLNVSPRGCRSSDRKHQTHSNNKPVRDTYLDNKTLVDYDHDKNHHSKSPQRLREKPGEKLQTQISGLNHTPFKDSNRRRKVYPNDQRTSNGKDRGETQPNSSMRDEIFLEPEDTNGGYNSTSLPRCKDSPKRTSEENNRYSNSGHRERSRSAGDKTSHSREYQTPVSPDTFDRENLHRTHTRDDQKNTYREIHSHNRARSHDANRTFQEGTQRSAGYETFEAAQSGSSRKAPSSSKNSNQNYSPIARYSHPGTEQQKPVSLDNKQSSRHKNVINIEDHQRVTSSYKEQETHHKDERIPHTVDDNDDYVINLTEEYIETFLSRDYIPEPKSKGYRVSRNVQFEDDRPSGAETFRYIASSTDKSYNKGVDTNKNGGINSKKTSDQRGCSRTYSPRHSHHTNPSSQVGENYECDDQILHVDALYKGDLSPSDRNMPKSSDKNSTGRKSRARESDILSLAVDSQRGNKQHCFEMQDTYQKLSEYRPTQSPSSPGESFNASRSTHDYKNTDGVFSISYSTGNGAQREMSQTTGNHRDFSSDRTRTVEVSRSRENHQQSEKHPTLNQMEYHPSSEDYRLSVWDDQVDLDDYPTSHLSSSHEDYQPSIKDYQPKRKKQPYGQEENQPSRSQRRSQDGGRGRLSPK